MVENNVESVREKGRYLETIINRKKRTTYSFIEIWK